MKRLFMFVLALSFICFTESKSHAVQPWEKTYGGSDFDWAFSIEQTTDEGYIVVGDTYSFGAGDNDICARKLDSSGDILWQKTYGGTDFDWPSSVQQTADGGYIVAGGTYSFGAGKDDVWVIKLDSNGDIAWQKAYGGSASDYAMSVQQTADGKYVVAGCTSSFGNGENDFWLLKLDDDIEGAILWERTYGGSANDYATSVWQSADGGYVVAGCTRSFGAGEIDAWIVKLDDTGDTVSWQKTYGGARLDYAMSIQQTKDGGILLRGPQLLLARAKWMYGRLSWTTKEISRGIRPMGAVLLIGASSSGRPPMRDTSWRGIHFPLVLVKMISGCLSLTAMEIFLVPTSQIPVVHPR